jgi:glycosyltransferase involved in cell wall biosynthesis
MTVPGKEVMFSIVIPTYNRGGMIAATIESILAQTYRNFEVIVVDDGSTDDTREVVKKYIGPKFFYYYNEHGERSHARNFGTSKAKGDYINWFDSDDIMLPGHLEQLAAVIVQYGCPALVGVGYEVERTGKGIVYKMKFPGPILNPYMVRYNFMLTMTGIVRRDVALAHPFNTAAIPREDHELWMRIATKHELVCTNKVTVRIIEHERSGSVITAKNARQYIMELDAFIHEVKNNPSVQQFLNGNMSRFAMYRYAGSAYYFASRGHKKSAMKLLFRSVTSNPVILFRKEFYAAVKNIIFTFS